MEAIEGDATHETSGAAMTCYQFVENCYLKLGKATRNQLSPMQVLELNTRKPIR